MTVKTHPYSAQLGWLTSGTTYAAFTDVKGIKPPKLSIGKAETTHLESSNAFRERIPGWGDAEDVTMMLYFARVQLTTLVSLLRVTASFQITYPLVGTETTASKWQFTGFITEIEQNEFTTDDEPIMTPVSFAVTGKPTFTQAT